MKNYEIIVFLSLGFIFANKLIITPLLIVLLLFTNDFATMAIATDNVVPSVRPERWEIKKLMKVGGILAFFILLFSFFIFLIGKNFFNLSIEEIQTLVFLTLVFTGQGNIYLVRERKHLWNSWPSRWLLFVTFMDIVIVSILAIKGVLMASLPLHIIILLFIVTASYLVIIDFLKIRIFSYFNI